jgi:multidrug efflux pump subunit AcrA (membrane-fusion protein)
VIQPTRTAAHAAPRTIASLVASTLACTLACATACTLTGCSRDAGPAKSGAMPGGAPAAESAAAAPTNRVDIPDAVRRNLGVVFAKVESRAVARTLRVPGRFEPLPTARREYRAPLGGQVELLVAQYQRVEAGTPLYRIDAPSWRALREEIIATEAKVASMGPLREAHRVHEKSLSDKVELWRERLRQLDELRAAGGGSAAQFTEARATLNATQADLADVMEKDASLEAEERRAEAELRALRARLNALVAAAGCAQTADAPYTVCAVAPGVVETLGVTQGGLAEESAQILAVVQPELVRFRARALQADLARLREGLPASIVAPSAAGASGSAPLAGTLSLGIAADPDGRTIDLIVTPAPASADGASAASWARAGVAASLEVTLEGGSADLAIPLAAVVRDGTTPILFRRDPKNPDKAIRLEADLGVDDGRWVIVRSGVREGDEIVVAGNYQLLLATSGTAAKGGHFHSDGTFHAEDH